MDVAGKSVEQQRWILERAKDDNVAEAFWRRDPLPLEILGIFLGKFAERLSADAGPATSDPSVMPDVQAPQLIAKEDAGRARVLALMGRVDLDRDAERRVLVRVGYPEAAPESVKRLSRLVIPRLPYEEAPDSGRPMPMDVDRQVPALKADDTVPKQICAGREGSLERLESPRAFVALGDKGQMTTSGHRDSAVTPAFRRLELYPARLGKPPGGTSCHRGDPGLRHISAGAGYPLLLGRGEDTPEDRLSNAAL
jgi:hypothetical protein